MDPIAEQLSQLMELTDDQLAELERAVLDEFEASENAELSSTVVERLESLANAVDSVRSEQSRRVQERQTLAAKAAEAAQRVRGPLNDPTQTPEGGPGQPQDNTPPTPGDTPTPPGDTTPPPGDTTPPPGAPPTPPLPTTPPGDTTTPPTADELLRRRRATPPAAAASNESQADGATELAAPTAPASAPAPAPAAKTPKPVDGKGATTNPLPDVQDQPPAQPGDTPAPIAGNPDIAPGPVDNRSKVPTKVPAMSNEETEPAEESGETLSTSDSETTTTTNPPEAPVTASAQGSEGSLVIEPPADRRPKTSNGSAATLSITAGADIPSVGAGSQLTDMHSVAEAFVKRLHTLRHVHGGDGEQHIVASLNFDYPDDRRLEAGDPQENADKIDKVAGPSIIAAAGICLPLETDYNMHCDVGVTDRPVRDALARFAADRGGIRYYTSPQLADYTNATGYWLRSGGTGITNTFHTYGPDGTTATSPADQKPCLEVNCPAENVAYIGAVTLCLTFNNLTGRVFPELVERQNELALVQHARIAENNLLRQIEANSTAVTIPGADLQLGVAREIFRLLARACATYRFQHRMRNTTPLRLVGPDWLRELVRADIAMQMPGDGLDETLGLADAKILTWFRNAGVNVTWHMDGVGPTQDATGFDFPTDVEFGLWAEGTWLYLDGGTLDLGIIRDSSLVATNQYKQFVETFEGVVNLGCGSYWVTAPFKDTGAAAALVDTT